MIKFFNSTPSVCLGLSIFNRLSEINVVLMLDAPLKLQVKSFPSCILG